MGLFDFKTGTFLDDYSSLKSATSPSAGLAGSLFTVLGGEQLAEEGGLVGKTLTDVSSWQLGVSDWFEEAGDAIMPDSISFQVGSKDTPLIDTDIDLGVDLFGAFNPDLSKWGEGIGEGISKGGLWIAGAIGFTALAVIAYKVLK